MLVNKIFKDIYKGVRIEKDDDGLIEAYTFDFKDVENCLIHCNLQEKPKTINMQIKDKYFLQPGDIVVATVPSNTSYHVGYAETVPEDKKIIIKKNFIILRNRINDNFLPEFVAEYLENFGIKELFDSNQKKEALVKQDIEGIDIPEIPIEKQEELLNLIRPINQRTLLYEELKHNDYLIKKYMISEVINNDK